ncbi:hypothetical protein GY45DRAFT_1328950 [Cubamyces sp. BRFM 1775]|nr:hypothetical protein GY45DRAFT_1328950 [Cubamyces sp. BRFM 1775]
MQTPDGSCLSLPLLLFSLSSTTIATFEASSPPPDAHPSFSTLPAHRSYRPCRTAHPVLTTHLLRPRAGNRPTFQSHRPSDIRPSALQI